MTGPNPTEKELIAERERAIERVDIARRNEQWRTVAAAAARIVEIDYQLANLPGLTPQNPTGRRSVKG